MSTSFRDPKGTLDAMMQAVVCTDVVQTWTEGFSFSKSD